MHTTTTLRSDSFSIEIGGKSADMAGLLPGFTAADRLGVVVDQACGALGASHMVLGAVTAFYDCQRTRYSDFFVYPDFYLFHVDRRHGNHGMLDIFPDHKEVVVESDPKSILQAVNDRRVTRLLVPDGAYRDPELDRITHGSLHITSALAYSPTGRVDSPDVRITGNEVTRRYAGDVIDASQDCIDTGTSDVLRENRAALERDGVPVESYRRISVESTLGMLV